MNLLDHLWQSTAFALAAGAFTLLLRANRARVRHWLWFAASVKFLLPLSLLIALGSRIDWKAAPVQPAVSVAVTQFVEPFTAQAAPMPVSEESRLPEVLLGVWFAGVLGITCSWIIRWRSIRAVVRNAKPLRSGVMVSDTDLEPDLEPGVFGIFRPVLVLPAGIFDRLTPAQLQAILAHEMCHIRHRDNLLAAIHMFVETVFWFHPLVWWIGKRMVAEREQACDEEVLRTLGEPQAYAEAILGVCKLYVESPLRCVSGVTGADLKRRIEAIMKNRIGMKLSPQKQVGLAVAGMVAFAVPVAIGIIHSSSVSAQATAKFEVAAIRPARDCGGPGPGAEKASLKMKSGGPGPGQGPAPGQMTICTVLANLIPRAYVYDASGQPSPTPRMITPVPIEGAPDWVYSETYQINAKADVSSTPEMMRGPMMQALLEDRFKLKIRLVTREIPVYALTVARGGRLQQVGGTCAPFNAPRPLDPGFAACGPQGSEPRGPNLRWGFIGTAEEFSKILFSWMDRPVMDKTELKGLFNFQLEFSPDESMPGYRLPVTPSDPIGGTSIFTAVQEQLGLKLEPAKGSGEFLVVDSVERPSEN
jgi:uncharacterized protein (TIGR03435 family)